MHLTKSELYEFALLRIAYLSEPDSDVAELAEQALQQTGVLTTRNEKQLDLFEDMTRH